MMNTQAKATSAKDAEQLAKIAALLEAVPDGLRDLIASKISGIIDGALLAVAIQRKAC